MHRCGHPKANAHALSTRHPHTSWPAFRDSSLSEEQIKGEGWEVCSNGLRADRVGNYCTWRTGLRTHIPLIVLARVSPLLRPWQCLVAQKATA